MLTLENTFVDIQENLNLDSVLDDVSDQRVSLLVLTVALRLCVKNKQTNKNQPGK